MSGKRQGQKQKGERGPRAYDLARRVPWEIRFWKYVDKDGANGCWNWIGSKTPRGYGLLNLGVEFAKGNPAGKMVMTHRLSYEMHKGPIPEGKVLDHLCRNIACCNPAHLEAVTQRENLMRGRGAPARNAAKTHCKRGHPFDESNTRLTPKGGRQCRACIPIRAAELEARRSLAS